MPKVNDKTKIKNNIKGIRFTDEELSFIEKNLNEKTFSEYVRINLLKNFQEVKNE